jgi:bifunctional DNA-binding transcriptional regulator/antitoxin component of YhaV-PrlF toxin-antitoxin module
MTGIYKRKVGAIKKSVYINIPSKISKEIGIAKGSVLYVTLEGGRVILSKSQDGKDIMKDNAPTQKPKGKSSNDVSVRNNLKHLLEKDCTW